MRAAVWVHEYTSLIIERHSLKAHLPVMRPYVYKTLAMTFNVSVWKVEDTHDSILSTVFLSTSIIKGLLCLVEWRNIYHMANFGWLWKRKDRCPRFSSHMARCCPWVLIYEGKTWWETSHIWPATILSSFCADCQFSKSSSFYLQAALGFPFLQWWPMFWVGRVWDCFLYFSGYGDRSLTHEIVLIQAMPASQKAIQLVQAVTGDATDSVQDVKSLVSSKPELLGTTAEEKKEVSVNLAFISASFVHITATVVNNHCNHTQVDNWLSWTEKNVKAAGSNVDDALQVCPSKGLFYVSVKTIAKTRTQNRLWIPIWKHPPISLETTLQWLILLFLLICTHTHKKSPLPVPLTFFVGSTLFKTLPSRVMLLLRRNFPWSQLTMKTYLSLSSLLQ